MIHLSIDDIKNICIVASGAVYQKMKMILSIMKRDGFINVHGRINVTLTSQVPDIGMSLQLATLVIIHSSVMNSRDRDFGIRMKQVVENGFLVVYVSEKKFSGSDHISEKNILAEFGIERTISSRMVKASWEDEVFKDYKTFIEYISKEVFYKPEAVEEKKPVVNDIEHLHFEMPRFGKD